MFIMSEVMFFSAWFWTFFKHALYPMGPQSPAVDGVWPPAGIETFDPWHLPIINTLILLCSGAAATWAHHALVHENNRKDLVNGLILAIALGAMFTVFQAYEYSHAAFGFAGNIYGATFFMATGFHGFHVLISRVEAVKSRPSHCAFSRIGRRPRIRGSSRSTVLKVNLIERGPVISDLAILPHAAA